MSTIKPRKKAAAKKTGSDKAGTTKTASKKLVATKSVARKSPAKTFAKKAAKKTSKSVAKQTTPRTAAKTAPSGTARATKKSPSSRTPSKTAAKPSAAGTQRTTARKATAAPTRNDRTSRPVSPKVAARHFREVLQAKQERVRQGPSYPPANAFTGQHAAEAGASSGGLDPHAPLPATGTPPPEALTAANSTHGRGNQGMRKQK